MLGKSVQQAGQQDPKSEDSHTSIIHDILLAELVIYIDGSRFESDTVPIFKLIDLAKLQ